jgi:hypothetical protein
LENYLDRELINRTAVGLTSIMPKKSAENWSEDAYNAFGRINIELEMKLRKTLVHCAATEALLTILSR